MFQTNQIYIYKKIPEKIVFSDYGSFTFGGFTEGKI